MELSLLCSDGPVQAQFPHALHPQVAGSSADGPAMPHVQTKLAVQLAPPTCKTAAQLS